MLWSNPWTSLYRWKAPSPPIVQELIFGYQELSFAGIIGARSPPIVQELIFGDQELSFAGIIGSLRGASWVGEFGRLFCG